MPEPDFDEDPEEWTDGYATAEEAALSDFPLQAEARVVGVRLVGDSATVDIELYPNHSHGLVFEYCERHNGEWFNVWGGG